MAGSLDSALHKAALAEKRGDMAEARRVLDAVLARFPANRRARVAADRLAQRAAEADAAPIAELSRLHAFYAAGDHAGAAAGARTLAAAFPRDARVHALLGGALLAGDDALAAIAALRAAIALAPAEGAYHSNLGVALRRTGRAAEAEAAYRAAIAAAPDHADAHFNLANLLGAERRFDDAFAAYDRALALAPRHVTAWYNRANLHRAARDAPAALRCYLALLDLAPDHADGLNNMGSLLIELDRPAEALAACRRATQAAPGNLKAWLNLGQAAEMAGALDEAQAALARATALDPDDAHARAHLLFLEAYMADWRGRDTFAALPIAMAAADRVIEPFVALPFEDDPARQPARARVYAQSSFARTAPPLVPAAPRADARIRIGYVSADFYDHATLNLMAGLLREHDRSRFEVRAYNYGPGEGSAARAAILPHLDAFVDVRALDDAAAVARIRDDALDIAIDLKGYTKGARAPLFVDRIAPVQIGWLGYPGSLGSDALDYIIGDAVVIPPGAERDYSEQVIRLPGSYQANDDRRAIADAAHTSRATFGLPDEALVLCCFNHPYKIGPREFDLWTRLLHAVPDAVLWLLRPNRWAEANLRREAAARGIDPGRLVFADMVPHAEHLARHVHADLFLDTFAVNAHTTASDAFWGGVPVLTLAGRQFAARVGASLVTAIGLPELVAQSEAEYEAIALALANDRAALAALRARLAANRLVMPLFDTARHARAIEAAYATAHRRRLDGSPPAAFDVAG